ncbi:MAG: type III polyketide synthase [Cytophagales bacterium]|nr:type III polyketide synthase [Cytophagales bacterium]
MSYIAAIGTAVPAHRYKQEEILHFMKFFQKLSDDDYRKQSVLYKNSGIDTRYCIMPDYKCSVEERIFYPKNDHMTPFPLMDERMQMYCEQAPLLAIEAIKNAIPERKYSSITHLITVSCTGMAAPGLDLWLLQKLNMSRNIHRTSVNFMGCYATIHAMKQAHAICSQIIDAQVLIVSVELCSLHFQRENTMDNNLSNLLFADGAAAMLINNDAQNSWYSIAHFYSEVDNEGRNDMAWQLSSKGFLMTLTSYIPQLLKKGFQNIVNNSLAHSHLSIGDVKYWAIHPGGKRILDTIKSELSLPYECMAASYEILQKFGNMSSPTISFVLEHITKNQKPLAGDTIFGAAFGPGLTTETFVLKSI